MIKQCKKCGKEFNSTYGSQYCSEECRNIDTGRKLYQSGSEGKCKWCGSKFIKRYGNERFCSVQCRQNAIRKKKREVKPEKHDTICRCVECGAEFKANRSDNKYCSNECRNKYKYRKDIENTYGSIENFHCMSDRANEMERLARAGIKAMQKANSYTLKECAVCGKEFKTRNKAQRTCNSKCSTKLLYARQNNRIPKEQIIDKNITLEAVYRRDSGVCYLCGGMCDWKDKNKGNRRCGDLYPSIDHIIPIAAGGLHAWGNVRLAHCICNSRKGADLLPDAEQFISTNMIEVKEIKPQKKQVSQFTLDGEYIRTFDSLADAERETKVKSKKISDCLNGRRKSTGGFKWLLADV